MEMALYDMSHAMIMMGSPVARPKTTGSNQFQLAGNATEILIILKK
jgi:hypothetical protein